MSKFVVIFLGVTVAVIVGSLAEEPRSKISESLEFNEKRAVRAAEAHADPQWGYGDYGRGGYGDYGRGGYGDYGRGGYGDYGRGYGRGYGREYGGYRGGHRRGHYHGGGYGYGGYGGIFAYGK